MRTSAIEILVIGCGIALGVLLVQALTQGASALTQLLALLCAGVVLFCVHLGLAMLRARRDSQAPAQPDQPPPAPRPLRRRGRNPFVRELTHDWIGLEDHATDPDPASPLALDDLDDALWGEPPQAPARKAAAKKADDSHQH